MSNLVRNTVPRIFRNATTNPGTRRLATVVPVSQSKPEGDISAVFVSLSGKEAVPLPDRFTEQKQRLILGHEEKLKDSWYRLLDRLQKEVAIVKEKGNLSQK
jgi:hypothetical protein